MTFGELNTFLANHRLVALYLTYPGCGPCKAVRPYVEARFSGQAWAWLEVDSTVSPEITGQLLVFAHPTLILFANGVEVGRLSRVVPRVELERLAGAIEAGAFD